MPPKVKKETAPASRSLKHRRTAAEERGLLGRAAEAVGLVKALSLSAREKKAMIEEVVGFTKGSKKDAARLLEIGDWSVQAAVRLYVGENGATVISDSDDDMDVAAEATTTIDVAATLKSSNYGRIMRVVKRGSLTQALGHVALPSIIVVGSESAGKSSTLERIAGLTLFPRDATICTRMPIQLRLIQDDAAAGSRVTVRLAGREDAVVSEADAARTVAEFMNEAVAARHGGTVQGVVDDVLTIEVRKPDVPTLDLIDLPGIVAASVEGEPADMMLRTRKITEQYMCRADTVCVCVVPANATRVRDSQAMQLVQRHGKEPLTIGVLAKADLAYDPRFKQRKKQSPFWELEDRLAGRADDMVALPQGWVGVKNRDTMVVEEEGSSLHASAEEEQRWFSEDAKIQDGVGINQLLVKIDALFSSHIRDNWVPRATAHLKERQGIVEVELDRLGPAPSSLTLSALLAEFVSDFSAAGSANLVEDAIRKELHGKFANDHAVVCGKSSIPSGTMLSVLERVQLKQRAKIGALGTTAAASRAVRQALGTAVNQIFNNHTGTAQLARFAVLRDALVAAFSEAVKERESAHAAAVESAVAGWFDRAVGGFVAPGPALLSVLLEVAVEQLVAPLVSDASAILPILGRLLAASKKPKPKKRGRPKKRPRTEGGDDDEQSDADEDAVVDESTFLVETHARQRQIRAAPPRARRLLGAPRNAPSSSSGNTKSSRLSTSSSTSNERTSRSIRLSSPRSGADRADATRASGAATRRLGAHRCGLTNIPLSGRRTECAALEDDLAALPVRSQGAVACDYRPLGPDDEHDHDDEDDGEGDDGPELARVLGLEELAELAHDEVHLLRRLVELALHVVDHAALGLELAVDLGGHGVDAVHGAVELLQVVVLLAHRRLRPRALAVDEVRVGHLEVRGRAVVALLGGDGGLVVRVHLRARAGPADGVARVRDAAPRRGHEVAALAELAVVDVGEGAPVPLDVVHREPQVLELALGAADLAAERLPAVAEGLGARGRPRAVEQPVELAHAELDALQLRHELVLDDVEGVVGAARHESLRLLADEHAPGGDSGGPGGAPPRAAPGAEDEPRCATGRAARARRRRRVAQDVARSWAELCARHLAVELPLCPQNMGRA